MTDTLSFHIDGWAAWAPGRDSEQAWRLWAGLPSLARVERPAPAAPVSLRRRLSPLGQAAMRCAWGLPNGSSARLVFASRNGEFGRTLSILDSLISGDGVSPADFTLSVHHALAGVLSIAQSNRRGHTSIAAGPDSFSLGLLEAATSLAESPEEPVVLVYYDEPLPDSYSRFATVCETHAVALSLSAAGEGTCVRGGIARGSGREPTGSASLAFLRFLLTGTDTVANGERIDWRWSRYAAAA